MLPTLHINCKSKSEDNHSNPFVTLSKFKQAFIYLDEYIHFIKLSTNTYDYDKILKKRQTNSVVK